MPDLQAILDEGGWEDLPSGNPPAVKEPAVASPLAEATEENGWQTVEGPRFLRPAPNPPSQRPIQPDFKVQGEQGNFGQDVDRALLASGDLEWALRTTTNMNAQEAMETARIAKLFRLPPEVARKQIKDLKDLESMQRLQGLLGQVDFDGQPRYPTLNRWVQDPYNLRASLNDAKVMADLEFASKDRNYGYVFRAGNTLFEAGKDVAEGLTQTLQDVNEMTFELEKISPALGAAARVAFPALQITPNKTQLDILGVNEEEYLNMFDSVKEEFSGERLPSRNAVEQVFSDVLGVVPQVAATAVASFAAPPAAPLVAGTLVYGRHSKNLKDKGVPLKFRLASGLPNAAIQGYLESLGVGKMVSLVQAGSFGKAAAMNLLRASATEGTTEFLQQFVETGAEMAGEGTFRGQPVTQIFGEFLRRLPETTRDATYEGFIGALFPLLPGAASVGVTSTVNMVKRGRMQTIENAIQLKVDESTLIPETMQRFVDKVTKNGPVDTVYVDPAAMEALYQGDASRLASDLDKSGITREQFAQAKDARAKLPIAMGAWTTQINPDVRLALQEDVAYDPNGLTAREVTSEMANIQRMAVAGRSEIARMVDEEFVPPQVMALREQLIENFKGKATAEDVDMKIAVAMAASRQLSKHRGESVTEWWARVNPTIQIDDVSAQAAPPISEQFQPAVGEEINALGASIPALRELAGSWPEVAPGSIVSGLAVGESIPNTASIDATFAQHESMGLREVPMELFGLTPGEEALASEIQQSRRIDPLIVVVDGHSDGPVHVLEGAHRLDALASIGVGSIPALVVVDTDVGPDLFPGATEEGTIGDVAFSQADLLNPDVFPGTQVEKPMAPAGTVLYQRAEVENAKLEGESDLVPRTEGADMANAFRGVKAFLYHEVGILSDFIPPTTSWWQPKEGDSLIEYGRRFFSTEGIELLRETFAGDAPPAWVSGLGFTESIADSDFGQLLKQKSASVRKILGRAEANPLLHKKLTQVFNRKKFKSKTSISGKQLGQILDDLKSQDVANWNNVKKELVTAQKVEAAIASGKKVSKAWGKSFLAGNRKTGGISWDFGLVTCLPTARCSVCYAGANAAQMQTLSAARVRHSIVTALHPQAVGTAVAAHVTSQAKPDLPFLRINGSGDTTFLWQVEAVNTAIALMDRPLHIFSRSHRRRTPDSAGLMDISNGGFEVGKSDEGAAVFKMGSIDKQLVLEYGYDWLRNNLRDRGIINSYLVGDIEDIPILKELHRRGIKPILHTDSKRDVVAALDREGLLATTEASQRGTSMPACPCALDAGPFFNGCATCLVSQGPCFAFGENIYMRPDGSLVDLESLMAQMAKDLAAGQETTLPESMSGMVPMNSVGQPRGLQDEIRRGVVAKAYTMAADDLKTKIATGKRTGKNIVATNPRTFERITSFTSDAKGIEAAQKIEQDWRDFATKLKSTREVGDALLQADAGDIDGIAAMDRAVGKVRELHQSNTAFTPAQGVRGSLRETDKGFIIGLSKTADLSTFLHEMSHIWREDLMRLVASGQAGENVLADWRVIEEWTSLLDDNAELEKFYDKEFKKNEHFNGREFSSLTEAEVAEIRDVAKHELWAQGFETYLMEGKAPSVALSHAFSRFRRWLLAIYRTLSGRTEINEEIRGVFDRILASEQEIVEAEWFYGTRDSMLFSVIPEGVGDVDRRERIDTLEERARERAIAQQTSERLKAWIKAQGGKKAIREQVKEDLGAQVEYRAIEAIKNGKRIQQSLAEERLGADDVDALDAAGLIRKGKGGMTVAEVQQLAEELQYESTAEMLRAASDVAPLAIAITTETERRVTLEEDRIVDELHEMETVPGEENFHNAARQELLLEEINALEDFLATQQGRARQKFTHSLYKNLALEILQEIPLSKAVRYDVFARNEAKYAREAFNHAAAGNLDAAKISRDAQIRSHYLVQESIRLRKLRDKSIRNMKKLAAKAPGKILGDYHDAILDILGKFGITEKQPVNPPIAIDELLKDLDKDPTANVDEFPPWLKSLTDEAYRIGDLTLPQLEDLVLGMNILAARGNNLPLALGKLLGDPNMTYDDVVAQVVSPMQVSPLTGKARKALKPIPRTGRLAGARSTVRSFLSEIRHPIFDFARADGLKPGDQGVVEKVCHTSLMEARSPMLAERRDLNKRIEPMIERVRGFYERMASTHGKGMNFTMPEQMKAARHTEWTAEMILSALLQSGTVNNYQDVTDGNGVTPVQLRMMASLLKADELRLLNEMWALADEFFPRTDDIHNNINGFRLRKEKAAMFGTEGESTVMSIDGEEVSLTGGYFPIPIDPEMDLAYAGHEERDILKNETNATFYGGKPKSSHTKARTGAVKPVRLSLQPWVKHFDNALIYIHMGETLNDLSKVFRNESFHQSFRDLLGEDAYTNLLPWLSSIARPNAGSTGNAGMNRLLSSAQRLAGSAALAWRMSAAAKQPLSLTSTIREIGIKPVIRGLGTMARHPVQTMRFIHDSSPFMQDRANNLEMEMSTQFKRIDPFKLGIKVGNRRLVWNDVRDFMYLPIKLGDMTGAYPTWIGAYNTELLATKDHDKSVAHADRVVSRTQPHAGTMFKNLWQLGGKQTGVEGKVLRWSIAPFTGWTHKYGNIVGEQWSAWQEGRISTLEFLNHLGLEWILPTVLATTVVGLAKGDDLDEPEDYAWNAVGYWTSWVPLLNLVPRGLQYTRAVRNGKVPFGEGVDFAILKPASMLMVATKTSWQAAAGDDVADAELWDAVYAWALLGEYLSGAPILRASKQMYDGAVQLLDGDTRNPFAILEKQKKKKK